MLVCELVGSDPAQGLGFLVPLEKVEKVEEQKDAAAKPKAKKRKVGTVADGPVAEKEKPKPTHCVTRCSFKEWLCVYRQCACSLSTNKLH